MNVFREFVIRDCQIDKERLVRGKTYEPIAYECGTDGYYLIIGKLREELKKEYECQSSFFDNVKNDRNLEVALHVINCDSNNYRLVFYYTEYVSDIKFDVSIEYGHNDNFDLGKFLLYKDDLCGINNIDPSIAYAVNKAIEPQSKIILGMKRYDSYSVYYKDPNNCINTLRI